MFNKLLCLFLLSSAAFAADVTMEKVPYGGWPNCVRVTNGTVELIATTDVGPRIIRVGFVGGQNVARRKPSRAPIFPTTRPSTPIGTAKRSR
ncbi:MAG: hypothetical protein NTZ09_12080 [Candidatus Hydrogenedentes bacterium]|nr:hypothetical protein [Candidatus Hydrogenedentota bacterium]